MLAARDVGLTLLPRPVLEDENRYHETMIAALARRRDGDRAIVDLLHAAFSAALLGLLASSVDRPPAAATAC